MIEIIIKSGIETLKSEDGELYNAINSDLNNQKDSLMLIAAASVAPPSVMVCEGTPLMNVTVEGYPKHRFHARAKYVDEIENLAIDRAKKAFKAQHANVQSHSASSANTALLYSFLNPGDTFLGLSLDSGGHLTHGSPASLTSKILNSIHYGLDKNGFIPDFRARTTL